MAGLCKSKIPGEEDLLIKELKKEETKQSKESICVISRDGLTLFGLNLPWIVILIVLGVLGLYLNSQGIFSENVGSVMNPVPVVNRTVPLVQSGGFKKFILESPGEIRKMYGH